jgi:hypothetical protein
MTENYFEFLFGLFGGMEMIRVGIFLFLSLNYFVGHFPRSLSSSLPHSYEIASTKPLFVQNFLPHNCNFPSRASKNTSRSTGFYFRSHRTALVSPTPTSFQVKKQLWEISIPPNTNLCSNIHFPNSPTLVRKDVKLSRTLFS